ncbi:MFS transporter [Natronosporangium hydrolyticum]|uniref:MFS transporter n=1 Tax=Natronosporangium hydrolyticum TaxID=2811111 RepID=A0A895Y9T6_9ACTN|nr:MFS transporter [Natronosporangium hydrolyticum]QSB13022.1 MFS transporter [Natronosporangium hydrolyticum]
MSLLAKTDLLLDTRPLRTAPAFRRLWFGLTADGLGHQLAVVALMLQVWHLTGDPFWVGSIGVAHVVPMIAFSLFGGSLADRLDRRVLLLWAKSGAVVISTLLAAQALAGISSLPLVLGLIGAQAAAAGLGAPARRAVLPRLLPRDQVAAGIALHHLSFQIAMLVGPAAAGIIAAHWGVAACYLINAAATGIALYSVARLPAIPPTTSSEAPTGQRLLSGWFLVVRNRVLRGAFLTDLAATLLAMPIALFPLVNEERFGGDPRVLGLFLSAIAVGGIGAGLLSGTVTRARRPGWVVLVAAAVWGIGLAGFGFAHSLWLALGCLAIAGAADTVSMISRGAIVQLATPDSHRGRTSSVEHVLVAGGPHLGNFRGGLVGGLTSSTIALVSGGLLAVVAIAAIAATHPAFRRFRPAESTDTTQPAPATPATL